MGLLSQVKKVANTKPGTAENLAANAALFMTVIPELKGESIATKYNYRKLFLETFKDLPGGYEVHHTLTQKYVEIMKAAGINIHEIKYLKGVDEKIHPKITTEWMKWDKSLKRMPTAQEVIDFAKKIDEKYKNYWFNK